MSLSDCEMCCDTPCECGHEYRGRPVAWLKKMRDLFDKLIREQEKAPVK